jgi:REP element-mobilizing transposase RayT
MAGTFSDLLFHIVFSTKDRIALIDDILQEDLYKYIGGIVRGQKGVLVEVGGMSDHIHLLVRLKPMHCISDFVREVKSGSSKWVNEEKWKLRKFGWQDGYGVFTVSRSQAPRVVKYVRCQREHHQRVDFKAEFIELLIKHEVEYVERYIWE